MQLGEEDLFPTACVPYPLSPENEMVLGGNQKTTQLKPHGLACLHWVAAMGKISGKFFESGST